MPDDRLRRRLSKALEMPKKERREVGAEQSRCRRRHLVVIIIVFCVIALTMASVGAAWYMRTVITEKEWIRTDEKYLQNLVQQVNENMNSTWKAKYNKFGVKKKIYGFQYTRNETAVKEVVKQIREFFNSTKMKRHIQELMDFPDSSLPIHFDARLKWPYCPSISRIPNQGGCGSCYAVAATGVASDRACIHSNGTFKATLSDEDVLGCCSVCGNCYGGDPLKALVYWVNHGIVTGGRDGCRPYSFDRSCGVPCSPATFFAAEKDRTCIHQCQNTYYQNNYDDDKHYATLAYSMYPRTMTITNNGERRTQIPTILGHINETSPHPLDYHQIRTILKKELFLFGPMTMAFPVTEEFLHYSSGVFQPHPQSDIESRIVYWHVVRLIGWGQDIDGSHYWIAVNSFGEHWGESGVFKIDTDSIEKYGLEYEAALV